MGHFLNVLPFLLIIVALGFSFLWPNGTYKRASKFFNMNTDEMLQRAVRKQEEAAEFNNQIITEFKRHNAAMEQHNAATVQQNELLLRLIDRMQPEQESKS